MNQKKILLFEDDPGQALLTKGELEKGAHQVDVAPDPKSGLDLFAKHEYPQVKGRRSSAINVLKIISDKLPVAKDYCEDIISIIRTLDDISDGSLKDVSQLDTNKVEDSYKKLQSIIPDVYVRNILNRSKHTEEAQELLLFAEQLA